MSDISVTEHLHKMQHIWSPQATGQFTSLMYDLILSAKIISRHINKAGLVDVLGGTGEVNVQGEDVQKLDELSNKIMIHRMLTSGAICALGSEEEVYATFVPADKPRGNYIIFFDPLDGSSNIDVNVSIGTIFSIFRKEDEEEICDENLLNPGYKQVAAGYFLYGPSTMLVYSTGQGVHGFTLDPSVGEFLLSHPDIQIPNKGKYYSANVANYSKWAEADQKAIDHFAENGYSLRYVGSLVADFHRTLLCGGLFSYPADSKNKNGKLRLIYEANPLAFLMEQAGGLSFDQDGVKITDKSPQHLHERTAFLFGSKEDVEAYRSFF